MQINTHKKTGTRPLKLLLVETFFKGSHKSWATELKSYLELDQQFSLQILETDKLSWKEAMLQGVEELAVLKGDFDLVITSSMVDLIKFKESYKLECPHIIYFHENQLAYPWTKNGNSGKRPVFDELQVASAKEANFLLFNSNYNLESFTQDHANFVEKSQVLPVGLELSKLDQHKVSKNEKLTLLWNHRWEYDKGPALFFKTLKKLKETYDFHLIVTGESPSHVENIEFKKARENFKGNIIHFGYAPSKKLYSELLWQSHIALNTSIHDFFGISVCEATHCDVIPILPFSLAYPEHFFSFDNFYKDEEEMLFRLEEAIKGRVKVESKVESYEWSKIIELYKEVFKGIILAYPCERIGQS